MIDVREKNKNLELDFVLEKIKQKKTLNSHELEFLCKFDSIEEIDHTDFSHLSKNQVFEKVTYYLSKSKKVICNIKDKNGMIDDEIISISNDFEKEYCILRLKHGETCKIEDKNFYKITYYFEKNIYSLEIQDEFYEKITIQNED